MNRTRWRQMAFVIRMELQRYFRGRRYIGIYVLAIIPSILLAVIQSSGPQFLIRAFPIAYAQIFGGLQLRLLIFFSCALIFSQLFRSEVLEKTLHYYFTAPIRREVLVVGKYLTALTVTAAVFGSTTVLSYFLFFSPTRQGMRFARSAVGIEHMWHYVAIAVLSCVAYGALFMLLGICFRNPMIPAIFIALWEYFNYVLPSLMQRFSITLYLQRFFPVTAYRGPIEVITEPPSALACTVILLLLSVVLVTVSCFVLRRTQITYSTD